MPAGTTITGTNTDGALSAGAFTVPPIIFTQHITDPAPTSVDIEARFALTGANAFSGSIDPDGMVRVAVRLKVDLDLRVEIMPGTVFKCSASPVDLVLEGHYDEAAEQVTLVDDDFSVPAVPATDDCMALIANAINGQLQGPGHSLRLVMEGAITPPLDPGEPTTTTLAVTPAGGAVVGQEVTLAATVAPTNDDDTGVPGGLVEFRDGSTRVGQVALDEHGQAALVTDTLAAGPRRLTANYLGTPPDYAASSSPMVAYPVTAGPLVTVDGPAAVRAGGDPVDLTVTATNSGYGADISAGRLEVLVERSGGSGFIAPPRLSLALVDGDTETPLALTTTGAGSSQKVAGVIDPDDGVALPAGASRSVVLRLSASSAMTLGALRVTVRLVDADSGADLAQGWTAIDMVSADRATFTWLAGIPANPGFPPFIPPQPAIPALTPTLARAGSSILLRDLGPSAPIAPGLYPSGPVRFSIDGRPLLARRGGVTNTGAGVPWASEYQLRPFVDSVSLLLPSDIGTGVKEVAVSYGGDHFYRPATASFPVTVVAPVGPAYDCALTGALSSLFRVQLEASAALPAVAPVSDVALTNLDFRLHMARHEGNFLYFRDLPTASESSISAVLGGGGAVEAESLIETNNSPMHTDEPSAIDYSVTLQAPIGHASIQGVLGEAVAVTVESITFTYQVVVSQSIVVQNTIVCEPAGEPLNLGDVVVAGTTMEAPRAVAVGAEATLRSVSLPAGPGVVEFLADGQTVGYTPTADGTAEVSTFDLPAGSPEVRAVYYPTGPLPTTMSEPVTVQVVDTCAPIEEGNGAVVRLVYVQLLNRCPDAAGYAHWVGQLDGGLSPEVFARQISGSLEARKVIVADAYRLLLDRNPEAAGATYWAERLGRNARYDDLLASIASSSEFRAKAGGTDTGVVARLYERIIGRAPDTVGRDYWVGVLDARGITAVVRSFVNLPEPLGAIVTNSYQDVLDRAPTPEERSAGVDALRATGNRSALYASLIATDDFAERAQTFPELT